MEFITLSDLRLRAAEVQRKLREQKELILTANGRPIAVIASVEGAQAQEILHAVRQARAQMALSRLRKAAAQKGLDKMTEEEIEAEIAAARQERYQQRS